MDFQLYLGFLRLPYASYSGALARSQLIRFNAELLPKTLPLGAVKIRFFAPSYSVMVKFQS